MTHSPPWTLRYEAGRRGGSAPATLNAADEVAVAAFLEGRLGFLGIPAVVERTLDRVDWSRPASVEEVLAVDRGVEGGGGRVGGNLLIETVRPIARPLCTSHRRR